MENSIDFVIVEFPEEEVDGNTPMSVISSTWLFNENDVTYCWWPSFKTDASLTKSVLRHEKVNSERCGKCRVHIKYRSREYLSATKKLKLLQEYTSVSETDHELHSRQRNVRCNELEDYAYSSGDEDEVPIPPKLNVRMKVPTYESMNSSSPHSTRISTATSSKSVRGTTSTLYNSTNEDLVIGKNLTRTECHACIRNEALMKHMLLRIETMSTDLKYLVQITQHNSNSDAAIINCSDEVLSGLPLSLIQHLIEFNASLEEPNRMIAVSCALQTIGGKDVVDCTRRLLGRICDHSLAITFNWSGRNGKNSFHELKNVLKLLLVTVRKNPLSRNASQQEVESITKLWLRSASDRNGGRSQRKNKQN